MAARLVMEQIDADPYLSEAFSEGKMLGVLICRSLTAGKSPCFIAAFSGNAGGQSMIKGFVPPIYDLTDPDGEFRKREADISGMNRRIEELLDSDRLLCLQRELEDALSGSKTELAAMRDTMAVSKARREQVRQSCTDPDVLEGLIRESQHEKAEYRRLKKVLDEVVSGIQERISTFLSEIESLKRQRAAMSENLQGWIFKQYTVHNALGETSTIADIFAGSGLTPPGGTGECAAPKLLEYAFRNGLEPLAMGEFWYGKASDTAVRCHGRFYPSCTSKCGPLLGHMLRGLHIAEKSLEIPEPVIIYEDEAVLVAEKPSGMPSVPGLDGRISLLETLQEMISRRTEPDSVTLSQQNGPAHLHAVHRLDMDTSGVMIFAKTHEAAVNIRRQFEEHTVSKTYTARVAAVGSNAEESGVIDLPLAPDYDERPRQKVDFKQGKEAYTEYEVVRKNPDGTADLLLYPHTGRTHQLRVHCAHNLGLGRPILGDLLYGAYDIHGNRHAERLYLHALSITFTHPLTGGQLSFTSDRLCYI